MKGYKEKRTVEVDVIEIEGIKFDAKTIYDFLEEAYEFEDTIGEENWTDSYLYFSTTEEKKLEPILIKLNVIYKPKRFECWNKEVDKNRDKSSWYDYYHYYLGKGYNKFYKDFWDIYNYL